MTAAAFRRVLLVGTADVGHRSRANVTVTIDFDGHRLSREIL